MALLDLQGLEPTVAAGGDRSALSVTGCPGKSSLSLFTCN
jgi:Lanthionine-containing peptide SapB precursor RamS